MSSSSQDLIRSVDTGLDREVTQKMEARAKRFNMTGTVNYEDIVALYER